MKVSFTYTHICTCSFLPFHYLKRDPSYRKIGSSQINTLGGLRVTPSKAGSKRERDQIFKDKHAYSLPVAPSKNRSQTEKKRCKESKEKIHLCSTTRVYSDIQANENRAYFEYLLSQSENYWAEPPTTTTAFRTETSRRSEIELREGKDNSVLPDKKVVLLVSMAHRLKKVTDAHAAEAKLNRGSNLRCKSRSPRIDITTQVHSHSLSLPYVQFKDNVDECLQDEPSSASAQVQNISSRAQSNKEKQSEMQVAFTQTRHDYLGTFPIIISASPFNLKIG